MPGPVKASPVPAKGKPQPEADTAIPSHLPFPPDMPAPRKPGK
jgi:hypothetical protein